MQQEEIEQNDDAATRASKSHDKSMNDKREQAEQMAEELIAEERHANPRSALSTYLIAAIVGLLIWAAIYYLWLIA
jgi:vacuolar-type H+-ATPase subunit H